MTTYKPLPAIVSLIMKAKHIIEVGQLPGTTAMMRKGTEVIEIMWAKPRLSQLILL